MDTEIITKLTEAKTVEQAERVIETSCPNWLVLSLDGYSTDYPHFQKNWETLCERLKTTQKKIILVSDIEFGDIPTVLNKICEFGIERIKNLNRKKSKSKSKSRDGTEKKLNIGSKNNEELVEKEKETPSKIKRKSSPNNFSSSKKSKK
jgi:hypothetical protein